MKQFINEADDDGEGRINMDDPIMQKTGWSKDNPDLTVGGVLKQGEKHPEYKAAKAIVDKEKGRDSGGEDDAGKLSGKSDFSRDGGDEPNPIGDPGDVPIGQLPDPSTRQGDPEKNKAFQAKKAAAAKAKAAEKPKAEPKPISARPKIIYFRLPSSEKSKLPVRHDIRAMNSGFLTPKISKMVPTKICNGT